MPHHVFCPKGHKIGLKDNHVGNKVACPKCQSIVVVPEAPRYELSDTSVLKVLGDHNPETSVVMKLSGDPHDKTRLCPMCYARVSKEEEVCPNCRLQLVDA